MKKLQADRSGESSDEDIANVLVNNLLLVFFA